MKKNATFIRQNSPPEAVCYWVCKWRTQNICQVEHSRHRSVLNFLVNLLSGLVAYTWEKNHPSISTQRPSGFATCTIFLSQNSRLIWKSVVLPKFLELLLVAEFICTTSKALIFLIVLTNLNYPVTNQEPAWSSLWSKEYTAVGPWPA